MVAVQVMGRVMGAVGAVMAARMGQGGMEAVTVQGLLAGRTQTLLLLSCRAPTGHPSVPLKEIFRVDLGTRSTIRCHMLKHCVLIPLSALLNLRCYESKRCPKWSSFFNPQ